MCAIHINVQLEFGKSFCLVCELIDLMMSIHQYMHI